MIFVSELKLGPEQAYNGVAERKGKFGGWLLQAPPQCQDMSCTEHLFFTKVLQWSVRCFNCQTFGIHGKVECFIPFINSESR